jgi:hypothetical protein
MKKFLAMTTAALLAVSAMGTTAFAADTSSVKLVVNGEAVDFAGDQEPVIKDGRTLVPFRAAFEKMGAEVKWFDDIRLCEAYYGDFYVGIEIDSTEVTLGEGESVESDVPAQIINGRTMVPLRVLSESIGATVDWDSATRTVTVTTPEIKGEAPEKVTYTEKTATVTGKTSTVTYTYPVVTDVYTAADLLNKHIEALATETAQSVADENAVGGDLKIDLEVKFNEGGIFSVMYLIDGEAVNWAHYGISNGAEMSDEGYYYALHGGEEKTEEGLAAEAEEDVADAEITAEEAANAAG